MKQNDISQDGAPKKSLLDTALTELEDFMLRAPEGDIHQFVISTVEKPLIEMVLYRARGNQSAAAKMLGINRNTLYTKMKKLGITAHEWKP